MTLDAERTPLDRPEGGVEAVEAVYDPEAFRQLAGGVVEVVARYLSLGGEERVGPARDAAGLEALFDEDLPRSGRAAAGLLERVEESILGRANRLVHPRYVGHQVAPAVPAAAAFDVLVSALNNSSAVWEMSPTGTLLERRVLTWFAGLLGWPVGGPDDAWGTFVSGGAVGNLTALAAARAALWPDAWESGVGARPVAILASEAAHYCVERAAGVLGLGSRSVVSVATRDGRMVPEEAARRLREVREQGCEVLALVGTAGTTPLGAIDPLAELAALAREEELWFHVDAAHGGALLISERLAPLLDGLEQADSLALDLHKMMFQPLSSAMVLVRRRRHLEQAFRASAPYLFHASDGPSWDQGPMSLQCSRRTDAMRAWFTLQLVGADALAGLQERTVAVAHWAWERLGERADFEPLHEPRTNILCFRHLSPALAGDEEALSRHQERLFSALNASGKSFITSTVLAGRRVLRMTIMNPRTGPEDLEWVFDELARLGSTS